MTTELLLMVGGLAILDTLSPATLGVTVYLLLTEKKRLVSKVFTYLITVAGFYFIVGASLMLGLDALLENFSLFLQNQVMNWIIFSIGLCLFIASFYVPTKGRKQLPLPKSKSLTAMVILGFTTSLIEVGSAFPYFAAIGMMSTANLPLSQWMLILAGYNVIMVVPSFSLFVLHLLFRGMLRKHLEKLHEKLTKNSGSALSWILCIIGLILMFNSIDYL